MCVFKPLSCVCGRVRIPIRVIINVMCLTALVVMYGQRCSVSISLTRMIDLEVAGVSNSCAIPNETLTERPVEVRMKRIFRAKKGPKQHEWDYIARRVYFI